MQIDPASILMITLAAFAVGLIVATINSRTNNSDDN